jgi:hypothetical protein
MKSERERVLKAIENQIKECDALVARHKRFMASSKK